MSKSTKWHRRFIVDAISAIIGVAGIYGVIIILCAIATLLLRACGAE